MKYGKWKCLSLLASVVALGMPVCLAAQDTASQDNEAKYHKYKLFDLGTFGGPASYLNQGQNILNNHGTLVGAADTATPDPVANQNFCYQFDCFLSHATEIEDGRVTDLGVLTGGGASSAVWISGNGLIAGISQNGEMDPLLVGWPVNHAVLWKKGEIIDLGTLGGGYESFSSAVNNRGQVVGFAVNTTPDPYSLAYGALFPTQTRAFLWDNGVMRDLDTLGGPDAFAVQINERSQVVGYSYTNSTPNPTTGVPTVDPFLWEDGKMRDLGTLGGTLGVALLINKHGLVVGGSNLAGDATFHPFLWQDGVMTDLGTLGGGTGTPEWLNELGVISGKADLAGPKPQNHHAVLWEDGKITDLGVLPGDSCSNAFFVNNHGQAVGGSSDRNDCTLQVSGHAVLWQPGAPAVDLNKLVVPGPSLYMTYAYSINERGEIAGVGVDGGCTAETYEICGHAYMLIPCDDSHLEVEGCEYDLVDAAVASSNEKVLTPSTPSAASAVANTITKKAAMQARFTHGYHLPSPGSSD